MAALGTLTHVLEVAARVKAAADTHAAGIGEAAVAAVAVAAPGEQAPPPA